MKKILNKLSKQTCPWAKPWHHLARAGLESFEGRKQEAIEHLVAATAGFDRQHLGLYAAVSRYRRGQLLGEEGRRLLLDAVAFMESEGIKNPARMADAFAPGEWG